MFSAFFLQISLLNDNTENEGYTGKTAGCLLLPDRRTRVSFFYVVFLGRKTVDKGYSNILSAEIFSPGFQSASARRHFQDDSTFFSIVLSFGLYNLSKSLKANGITGRNSIKNVRKLQKMD